MDGNARTAQWIVSLSAIHLTDLDHIFVRGATPDCFRDVCNRGVYSNGHHLYWHSHCLPSQHGGVQNLRVLETEREGEISTATVEGLAGL